MRLKFIALSLIFVFTVTSSAVFANNAQTSQNQASDQVAFSKIIFVNNNLNMEYCSVDLADRNSNLNVRTWEGDIIGKLRHGTRVFVNEYSGEWARVSVKRGRRWVSIGWVDSTFLLC